MFQISCYSVHIIFFGPSCLSNTSWKIVITPHIYSLVFSRLHTYLGGAWPARADVTRSEHLLVAQDPTVGVLLVVQELLESAKSIFGV